MCCLTVSQHPEMKPFKKGDTLLSFVMSEWTESMTDDDKRRRITIDRHFLQRAKNIDFGHLGTAAFATLSTEEHTILNSIFCW
jgi:hypothetical protein